MANGKTALTLTWLIGQYDWKFLTDLLMTPAQKNLQDVMRAFSQRMRTRGYQPAHQLDELEALVLLK